jgi:HEAT repeat protein
MTTRCSPKFRLRCVSLLGVAFVAIASATSAPQDDAAQRWIASLRDPRKRLEAAYSFDEMVKEGKATIPALVGALADADPFVRSAAAAAAGEVQAEPGQIVPALVEALGDNNSTSDFDADTRVSDEAMISLAKIGAPAVPALVEIVRAETPEGFGLGGRFSGQQCVRAAVALGDIGAPAVAPLIETLRLASLENDDFNLNRYWNALFALRRIGRPAVPLLVRAEADPSSGIHLPAALVLVRIRSDLKAAGRATSEIDAVAGRLVTSLAAAARHGDFEAVQALGRLDSRSVPALVAVLRSPEDRYDRRFPLDFQGTAIEALENLGPEARDAVPALLAVRDKSLRSSAIGALGAIGSTAAVRSLTALVAGRDQDDAVAAVDALALLGPRASSTLTRAVEKRSLENAAAAALAKLGPAAVPAVPALVRMVQRPADPRESEDHRIAAVKALGAVGPTARAAIPALVAALRDRTIAVFAVDALVGIGPQPEVVHALVELLGADDKPLALEACVVLREFGAAAGEAVPSLERLQKGGGELGYCAALALAQIEPDLAALGVLSQGLDLGDDEDHENDAVIEAFAHIGARGVPTLVAALHGTASRRLAARALAHLGATAIAARRPLETVLEDPDPSVGEAAARGLVAIGAEMRGALATVLIDSAIQDHLAEALEGAAEYPPYLGGKGSRSVDSGVAEPRFPRFPWPPPRFSAHDLLPPSFLGSNRAALADVYRRLASALQATGFEECGVFEAPGGFALVTQVERIREDGSSAPRQRWSGGKARPLDLFDYLGRLFLQRPGEFRLIAFLVTTEDDLGRGATLSEAEARVLFLAGARSLPPRIGRLPLDSRSCHVLIYHFERQHGAAVVLYPSSLPAREHLRKAGLWGQLAR